MVSDVGQGAYHGRITAAVMALTEAKIKELDRRGKHANPDDNQSP